MGQSISATIDMIKMMRDTSSNFSHESISDAKAEGLYTDIDDKISSECLSSKTCNQDDPISYEKVEKIDISTLITLTLDEKIIKKYNAMELAFNIIDHEHKKIYTIDEIQYKEILRSKGIPLNKNSDMGYISAPYRLFDRKIVSDKIIEEMEQVSNEFIKNELKDTDYVHPDELDHDPIYTAVYNHGKIFGFHVKVNIKVLTRIVNECEFKEFTEFDIKEGLIRLKNVIHFERENCILIPKIPKFIPRIGKESEGF